MRNSKTDGVIIHVLRPLFSILAGLLVVVPQAWSQMALPSDPVDPNHPGSRHYSYASSVEKKYVCNGREVTVVTPSPKAAGETFPVVVYGHGQALGIANDRATLVHLARKGVATIYPIYDTGFFDQDWTRMGRDYVTLSDCAIRNEPSLDRSQVVFSGFSKGAYVGSIAAGLSYGESLSVQPKAAIFFETAGVDLTSLAKLHQDVTLTVVFADNDSTVKHSDSETLFQKAPSIKKQFILLKSYNSTSPRLIADHFWPLTKASAFGGKGESAFHPHSMWKWLIGAAMDVRDGGPATHPAIYGADTVTKGIPGEFDDLQKSWP